ncbi:MAG: BlaI/MecI/CopY family transcriptional regulator [Phaeodactylibacter sp.]|uniref:BlaI/MecI/CopY family transcriptional regulator n=1 Tax=Phaeodactylibacter sp. TaxID=1940289 RepID=UPI0032EAB620
MRRLNEKEEAIMQALWRLERAFVKEIIAELEPPPPPVTTVSSVVRKLEGEGFIGHESFGKTYRYFPAVSKEEYRSRAFQHLMQSYFESSAEALLSHFVREEEVSYGELEALLDKIKKQEDHDTQ